MSLDQKSLEIWNQFSKQLKSEKTKQYYLNDLSEYSSIIGKPFFMSLRGDAEEYYEIMRRRIEEKEIAGSTVLRKFKVLSKFTNDALNMDIYPRDALLVSNLFVKYVAILKKYDQAKRARKMGVSQLDQLLGAAVEDKMLYAIITMAGRLGMSVPEICRLLYREIFRDGEEWYIEVLRNKKRHILQVPKDVKRVMQNYEDAYGLRNMPADAPYFQNFNIQEEKPRALSERVLENRIKKLAESCDLDGFSLRDVRNSAAVIMFAYGADVSEVAWQLGVQEKSVERYKSYLTDQDIFEQASSLVNLQVVSAE